MTTFPARDIARWFVAWAENLDAEVSNLKLQKLLYYAHGHHLGATGEPLFTEGIQAWAHGPVVVDVYHEYKKYGKGPIDPDIELGCDFNWDDFAEVADLLVKVWDRYGSLAAWALRERTHREAPWKDAFDGSRDARISDEAIRAYFAGRPL
ncbi:MAG: DUF4065 domain-containing protein [Gordonia sp. (in: high G+C Gram-positive bacteria)]